MQSDGKATGLWLAGHVVFGSCIFVVNVVILVRYNTFEKFGVFLVLLMCFAFYFFLGLQSISGKFPEISHVFEPMMTMWTVQLSFVFMVMVTAIIEIAVKFVKEHR